MTLGLGFLHKYRSEIPSIHGARKRRTKRNEMVRYPLRQCFDSRSKTEYLETKEGYSNVKQRTQVSVLFNDFNRFPFRFLIFSDGDI